MNKDLNYSFDFELTDDNRKAIEALLKSDGVRKYVIKLENDEYLDLVEFKEYERLNNVINELEEYIKSLYIPGHTIQNASLDSIIYKLKKLKENK